MPGKHLNRRLSSTVILILSVVLLVVFILYFSQRVIYSNENEFLNEELEHTNIYFYQIHVESPLRTLLNYLTIRPVEEVDWEEQLIQETTSIFLELDKGITNISTPEIIGIPDNTRTELEILQGNIGTILSRLQNEQPLDMETKERIMSFTQSINECVNFAERQSWERFTSDMKCLNK